MWVELFVVLFFLHGVVTQSCTCNLKNTNITIIDDKEIDHVMSTLRTEFLSQQASKKFDRLAATILIKQTIGDKTIWRRGSAHPTETAYPASCVKLTYMLSAIEWCKTNKKPIDCLDKHVRPMITVSSNLATGFVIDAITNTTNIDDMNSTSDPRWSEWIQRRRYTENLLISLGLYENQRTLSKTFPTNSGQGPVGAEKIIIDTMGRNLLQPCCAASIMLYIMEHLAPNERDYAKSLLYHTLESAYTTIGRGLPAGTVLYNKVGEAYDTVEDIAHFTLPNGQQAIMAVFSNGFQRPESDSYILARFAEVLIERLRLNDGSPPVVISTADTADLTCEGSTIVKHVTDASSPDAIGKTFFHV
jgi:hypothetical protein